MEINQLIKEFVKKVFLGERLKKSTVLLLIKEEEMQALQTKN
jgi:hypothetical protein